MMLVHVDNLFMAGKPETINNLKENIKEKFSTSESGKVKNFFGVYFKWSHNGKGTYGKITMEKDVRKLVE